jgi:SAM-dependent methyltransferase
MTIVLTSEPESRSESVRPSRASARGMSLFRWSREIAQRLEHAVLGNYSIETIYRNAIISSISEGALVLDAGAGERCIYSGRSLRVIGSDVLLCDLKNNPDVQFVVLANLERDFPFRPGSLDAVTACYFVEHIHDSEQFIQNAAAALRPGGKVFLLFPCRYSPFAVINRMISNSLTVRLLRWFVEDSHGGFPATYNNCWPERMREVLKRCGLQIVGTEVCFYQSHYYASFLPLYLCSLAYDLLMKALNVESMAASACIFAEKPNSTQP